MPVSHVGLTVSHLPTSCSFFLAALTPLGYRFAGQEGNQIGFGVDGPEFFISQETEGVRAGAAHIAFSAPSRNAVDGFFVAALKAGGRIHGEPALRDPATGYYSAAVLDFDNNSIEVMHRRTEIPSLTRTAHSSDTKRVLSWQKDVAGSTVIQSPQIKPSGPPVIVTNITKPTIMVSNPSNQTIGGGEMSSKSLIGTLLGAAAGAAVAYAMTKGDEGRNQPLGKLAYQAVEAARSQMAPTALGSQKSHPQSTTSYVLQGELQGLDYPRSQLSVANRSENSQSSTPARDSTKRLTITALPPPQASTLIETFIPPSEVPRYRRQSISRSQTDGALPSSRSSRVSSHATSQSKPSRVSSAAMTVTQADKVRSGRSSVVTEVRQPRDLPLPPSKAASIVSRSESDLRRRVLDLERHDGIGTVIDSVAPSDSISQADSKRSRGSKRSSRHSSRAGTRRDVVNVEEGSQVSQKTVKAARGQAGSRRESIMSLPIRSSSKTSVHRSVVSFLPGM
ncbi:MAG: hypothetical protein Q9212_001133 [Teloschistes hypoglaucus]